MDLRGLAHPWLRFPSVANDIARLRAGYQLEEFTHRHGRLIRSRGPGLQGALNQLGQLNTLDEVWAPDIARLGHCAAASEHAVLCAAVRAALHGSAQGQAADWSASWRARVQLTFAGFSLPQTTQIRFTSNGWRARIEVNSHPFSVLRHRGTWHTDQLKPVPGFGVGPCEIPINPCFGTQWDASSRTRYLRWARTCGASALRLIEHCAPRYVSWVHRVIHSIEPIFMHPGLIRSASSSDRPGVMGLSGFSSAVELAELLVHEAAHQYVFLTRCIGPTVNQCHRSLYYSSARGTKRPLDSILLAFHAFANVLLFYQCVRQASGAARTSANERRTLETTRQLADVIRNSAHLTELGSALTTPLLSRLAPVLQ